MLDPKIQAALDRLGAAMADYQDTKHPQRTAPPDNRRVRLHELAPGAEFTLRALALRHDGENTEVVIFGQSRVSKIALLPRETMLAGGEEPVLGYVDPGSEILLQAATLPWIGGEYVEVSFPAVDCGESYTVWLLGDTIVEPGSSHHELQDVPDGQRVRVLIEGKVVNLHSGNRVVLAKKDNWATLDGDTAVEVIG